jgi:hypothetical protein
MTDNTFSHFLRYQRRLTIVFIVVMTAFMLFAGYMVTSQQRQHLLVEQEKRLQLELELISEFIAESFLKRDYSGISDFLHDWSRNRRHIVALKVRLKNGYELLNYQRSGSVPSVQWVNKTLSFQDNALLLEIAHDFTRVENLIRALNLNLFIVFAGTIMVLAVVLWISLQRLVLSPLGAIINQRAVELENLHKENFRLKNVLESLRESEQK